MATRKEKERRGERTVSAQKRMDSNVTGTDYGSIAIPQGMKLFKPKQAGVKRIEVIPFLTGKGNPVEKEEGVPYFERTYWVHRGIGPDNGAYCCLRRTFGKACPVCDHRASLMRKQDDENEDLIRELAPKQRQLFLVMDHAEWDTGMQLWDVSYHLFGKYLDKKIQDADEEDDYHLFADLKKGKTLKIGIDEKSSPYGNLLEFSNIEFKERSKDLDAGLLEEAPCLDEILKELSYKELKAILLQLDPDDAEDAGDGESDGEERGKRSVKKDSGKKGGKKDAGVTADDLGIEVGSTVEHSEFGECEVIHVSGDGTSLRIQDADGEVHRAITPADVTLAAGGGDEDEDEEEKPKGRAGKKPASKKKKDEEDEDDDDPLDDEEDEDEDEDEDDEDKEDEDEDKDEDDDPDDEDEDEDEDEKPTRRGRAPAKPTKPAKPGGKPRGRK